jgi:hypothetical protein
MGSIQPGYVNILLATDRIERSLNIGDIVNVTNIHGLTEWIRTTPDIPSRFRKP